MALCDSITLEVVFERLVRLLARTCFVCNSHKRLELANVPAAHHIGRHASLELVLDDSSCWRLVKLHFLHRQVPPEATHTH